MMTQKNFVSCLNKYSINKPTWAFSYTINLTLDKVLASETLAYVNRLMQLSAQEDCTEFHHQESVKMYTPHVPNINTNGYHNFKWVKECLIHPLDKWLGLPQGKHRYGYENGSPCPLC
jgi:thioester reductase-like protein